MSPARALLERLRRLDPRQADLLLAGALLVEFQLELALLVPGHTTGRALAALMLAIEAGGLALRRRAPLACVALVLPILPVGNLVLGDLGGDLFLPFFGFFLAIYSLGRHARTRSAAAGSALAVALVILASVTDPSRGGAMDPVMSIVILVAAPVLIGRLLRNRAYVHQALRRRAAELERSRSELAERAVNEERARIAGELHDVVAHALGAMTVQASAARRLATEDAERARGAFAAIEGAGREALDEIRRLLGVLRREDDELALAPQPSLRHVDSLARRISAAGLPVELSVEGDVETLPAGVDLTAYRVVQEALGAALEGAGAGRARVRVSCGHDELLLEVADDGGNGRRLLGVRERVAFHGGQLYAGARGPAEHVVRARLPIGAAA